MDSAIVTEELSKDFGAHRALDHLSIQVRRGEIFGFLGPNGAGKTTTIRLLLDLIRPTGGRASILGYDCQFQSVEARSVIGYLPGDLRLYPGRSGRKTVEMVAGLRGHRPDNEHVNSLARALDLDLSQHAGTLSKGNRQKLGILLAMFHRPEVFLLDEPTSGLDPIMQRVVWELLRKEADRGAAIFFSSHVMSEVESVCQRVAILRQGELVAVEPIVRLKERVLRRLEISFASVIPEDAFQLADVREIARNGKTVTLEVAGNLDQVIRAAAQFDVVDLRTEQASLDDLLLAYYRDVDGMKNATLYFKALRDIRGATIGIATLIAIMALVDLLIYPSYRDSFRNFQLPEVMQGFLGNEITLGSPAGFIAVEYFSWIPLVLIILAIAGGTAAFAGEEAAGTMDLLLAQPVRRTNLALAKGAALASAITVAALSGMIGFAIAKNFVAFDIGLGRLAIATISMLPVTLLFLGLSLWASALLPSRGMAAMLITGLVVISYFIQILGESAPVLRTVRQISPFYWSEPSHVLLHGFDPNRSGALLLLAMLAMAASVRSFDRRDITAGAREWHLRDLSSLRSMVRKRSAETGTRPLEGS